MTRFTAALSGVFALAVFGALFVGQLRATGDFRVDDAYISFSFAKNAATGQGLTYAFGQKVEGYSNFLWVLISAAAYRLNPDGILTGTRNAAVVFAFSLGAGVYLLARLRSGPWVSALAVVLLGTFTDIARAAMSGLETVAYSAALLFAFWAYLREPHLRRRWSLFAFVPVALLRIDGALPFAFIVVFELVCSMAERRFRPLALLRWVLPASLCVSAYWLWRWHYYGLLFPTTYYAKNMAMSGDEFLGRTYVWEGIRDLGLAGLLLLAAFGVGARPSRAKLCIGGFIALHSVYVASVGGDWMPFNRFLLPIVPLVLALFAWGASELWDISGAPLVPRVLAVLIPVALAYNTAQAADAREVDSPRERWKLDYSNEVSAHTKELLRARRFVAAMMRNAGEKLVTDYGGVFAFATDAHVIEMWGLCNADIAIRGHVHGVNPTFGKTCPSCYETWQPDYFHVGVPLLRSAYAFGSFDLVIEQVFQGPELDRVLDFRKNYAVGRVFSEQPDEALFFLERRRPGIALVPRTADGGLRVDYPFEPRGDTM